MKSPSKQHGVANESVWREPYVIVTMEITKWRKLFLTDDLIGWPVKANEPIKR